MANKKPAVTLVMLIQAREIRSNLRRSEPEPFFRICESVTIVYTFFYIMSILIKKIFLIYLK
ncbi:hypothetical protein Llac01_17010 [Leuconostoc lactis]|nr:hypothetical protein LLA04_15900 [Leuconostoc lactis]GLY46324.1 hypothetical protein Llac01_17010 [Leuconostoc lactis]